MREAGSSPDGEQAGPSSHVPSSAVVSPPHVNRVRLMMISLFVSVCVFTRVCVGVSRVISRVSAFIPP